MKDGREIRKERKVGRSGKRGTARKERCGGRQEGRQAGRKEGRKERKERNGTKGMIWRKEGRQEGKKEGTEGAEREEWNGRNDMEEGRKAGRKDGRKERKERNGTDGKT